MRRVKGQSVTGLLARVAVALLLICATGSALAATVIPMLDPSTLTKFQDPLFIMPTAVPTGTLDGNPLYDVDISQFQWQFSSQLPKATVWGYNGSMPGPTFVVNSGQPISVRYTNNLVNNVGNALAQFLPVDTTMRCTTNLPQNRTVVDLYGGHVPASMDGCPWNWFGSDPAAGPNGTGGPAGNSVTYTYPNCQQAGYLWYHDNAMGQTRLNTYAGMVGSYLIHDAHEASLNLPTSEVPLVLQDKMFTADGQLFYPRGPGDLTNPGGPNPLAGLPKDFPSRNSAVSEFFGNVNVVNGTIWPKMDVEARKYRFQLLDGANARTYVVQLTTPDGQTLPIYQIGTDGGLLPNTVVKTTLRMMPGERTDVIVDFSGLEPGTIVTMKNIGPDSVYQGNPSAKPADPKTTGQVMQFCVGAATSSDTSVIPLQPSHVTRLKPQDAAVTRSITLRDSTDKWGRDMVTICGSNGSPETTTVNLGDTEVWDFFNLTEDTQPMHLHDVQFQIVGRQMLKVDPTTGEYLPEADPTAAFLPPDADELGWKDTLIMPQGYMTSIISRFDDFTGSYMFNCGILEHQEFDMMSPFEVVNAPEPASMTLLALGSMLVLRRRR